MSFRKLVVLASILINYGTVMAGNEVSSVARVAVPFYAAAEQGVNLVNGGDHKCSFVRGHQDYHAVLGALNELKQQGTLPNKTACFGVAQGIIVSLGTVKSIASLNPAALIAAGISSEHFAACACEEAF